MVGGAQQQRRELVECLEGLTDDQWSAETVCDHDVARVEVTGDPGLQGALASADRGM